MKEDDEKPHPWAPVPGIDEDYSDLDNDDAYELVEGVVKPGTEDMVGVEFMIDCDIPPFWQRRFFRRMTKIKMWTKSDGWNLVAKFISPMAATEYARILSREFLRMHNGVAKQQGRRRTH